MANGKVKQPKAASKAPIKKPQKAKAGGTSRAGAKAPDTTRGSLGKKSSALGKRRDAAGSF